MRKIILLLLLLRLSSGIYAAPVDTLTPAQLASTSMTVEQLLGVPPVYTVVSCSMLMSSKDKGVFLFFYCRDASGGCATINAETFPMRWSADLQKWLLGGYNFIIADIDMQRGARVTHWQQKSFAARR
ncbi:MAG: hypothetical protein JST83_07380 [Bacteroidetes bacterium]|nr:hypothetical protein [Bacteroidota bacterium]